MLREIHIMILLIVADKFLLFRKLLQRKMYKVTYQSFTSLSYFIMKSYCLPLYYAISSKIEIKPSILLYKLDVWFVYEK